ncbi:MAG: M15 family metallopeptidase [Solobacterium sp.]|nr:M15 family metallopeptidase [Solobacterium sp.]
MKNDIISRMQETVTLEGNERKKWTAVFVSAIVLFSVCCMIFFHLQSDSLARYPFKDKTSKDLIRQYLTQEEIEYIIEYSIPPNMFIAYIQENGFSIYHAAEYKKLSESQWDKSPKDIVDMVEETRNIMSVEELENYLSENNYRYEDVSRWIKNESEDGVLLIPYAMNTDAYLDLSHTVSSRTPATQPLAEEIPVKDGTRIEVREEVQQPLLALCSNIQTSLASAHACAGLQISQGYVSYSEQAKQYHAAEEEQKDSDVSLVYPPGHDEHQLGLAVDFSVEGLPDEAFAKTIQAEWLASNAWKFGFIQTWNPDDEAITLHRSEPWHYRFVGTELAKTIHDSGLTFARYKAQIKQTAESTPAAQ